MKRKTPHSPPPFARHEWMLAWAYLRARRAEGGVNVMTWISIIGITLAVFALIATMAVRTGFRAEFVDTILGANAHASVYATPSYGANGRVIRGIADYDAAAKALAAIPGVTEAAPLIKGQVLANAFGRNAGVEVFGIRPTDLAQIPRINNPNTIEGNFTDFDTGIAIGSGVARELGVGVGDAVKLISPDGVKTAFGTSPRVKTYSVRFIFTAGRFDIDRTRIYMPFDAAADYFGRQGRADQIDLMLMDPEAINDLIPALMQAAGDQSYIWTWQDASGAFLRALTVEDNVMFILMAILVLIAVMNITSGLIMLVKNKTRDIGILRTIGLTEGAVLRVFFLCGSFTGIIGTALGTGLGCLFALYIDPILSAVNYLAGGGVWDPAIRGIYTIPAQLQMGDVLLAVALSLGLSFVVTYVPARRAARLDPVKALRDE